MIKRLKIRGPLFFVLGLLGSTLFFSSPPAKGDESTPLPPRVLRIIHSTEAPLTRMDLSVPPETLKQVSEPCSEQRSFGTTESAPHEQALELASNVVQVDEDITRDPVSYKTAKSKFGVEFSKLAAAAKRLKAAYKDDIRIFGLSSNHSLNWDVEPTSGTISVGYKVKVH